MNSPPQPAPANASRVLKSARSIVVGALTGLLAAFAGSFGFIFGGLFATVALYMLPFGDGVGLVYAGFAVAGVPSLYLTLKLGQRLATDQNASVRAAWAIVLAYFALLWVPVAAGTILST